MLLFASWLLVGCQSKPEGDSSAAPVSQATANQPAAAGKPVHRDRRPNEHSASTASRKHADSSPPNRNNPIGHAITVGGLREVPDGHLELAILDPADNEITGRRALGIVGGLRSWIDEHVKDAWRADLSFLGDAARRLSEKVLKAGLPIRFETPGVEAALDAARAISAEADRDAPKNSRARSGIRTRYDG